MTQFVSPDDEHDVLETCRVKNKNKYIVKNLRHVGHLPRIVKDQVVQSLSKLRVHFNNYGLVTFYTSTPESSPNTLIRRHFKDLVARVFFSVETGALYCATCQVITR